MRARGRSHSGFSAGGGAPPRLAALAALVALATTMRLTITWTIVVSLCFAGRRLEHLARRFHGLTIHSLVFRFK